MQKSISVIIPAYNEEKRIRGTLESLIKNMSGIKEIIVVVDGTDETEAVAKSVSPYIKVLKFSKRLGKGGAVIEGFKQASGDVIAFVDADGSIPWYEVQRLSSMVNKNNSCVVGSRWTYKSRITRSQPRVRIIVGRMYRYLTSIFLGITIKDVQCGLKCFDHSLAKQLVPKVYLKDWSFDTSLIYNTMLMGKNVLEVGIEWADKSNSKVRIFRVAPMMFAYIIGLRIVHSKFGSNFSVAFQKLSNIFAPV